MNPARIGLIVVALAFVFGLCSGVALSILAAHTAAVLP
jgi:hypothetical protein